MKMATLPPLVRSVLNLPEPASKTDLDNLQEPAEQPAVPDRRSTVAPWQQLTEADAPRRWQKMLRRCAWVVLLLFAFIGVRAAFAPRPSVVPAPPLPVAATYPTAAAGGAASRFATIYATWSQDAAQVRRNAMATVWGGDPNVGWNGKGWQSATSPAVVDIAIDSAQLARVTVVMTVTSWTKDAKGKQSNVTSRPMALQVPVRTSDNRSARVSGLPAWVAVPSVSKPQTAGATDADSALTSQTKDGAAAFFAAYGRDGDLSSLTAPGSALRGLNGALTLGTLRQWTVHTVAGDTAQATAEVIWSSSNGSTITQTYYVTLRRTVSADASRWLVLSVTAR